jgi:hypothetical protein
MRLLGDTSVKVRLVLVTLAGSSVGLLLAFALFAVYVGAARLNVRNNSSLSRIACSFSNRFEMSR